MSEIGILFGSKVRELRKAKHMSQEELAYKASISPAHLGQIERAQKNPTLDTIYRISLALDIPVNELLQELPLTDLAGQTHKSLFSDTSSRKQATSSSLITDKIVLHINRMSEQQKKEILRLIRIVEHFSTE